MLSWLSSLWKTITGDIASVTHWVLKTIQAVYSFIDREFGVVERYATDIWHSTENLFNEVWKYILQVYNYAKAIVDVVIHNLISWVTGIWNDVFSFAKGVYEQLVQWVDFLKHAIAVAIDDVRTWIINSIWNPLFKAITEALNWIAHEGAFVYDLLTHPDKLFALLAAYIWGAWIGLFKKYGRTIARWLMHEMMSLTGDLADILEAIISGML